MTDRAPERQPLVRPATLDDARAIAEIRVASWRATYAGTVPASILDWMDVDRNEAWLRGLIREGRTILVVEDSAGRAAGYAMAGPARDDDADGFGEIEAIYLAPEARGRGLGAPLLAAARATLARAGHHTHVLWVLTDNWPARRFYERQGFAADGAVRTLDFDGTPIEEVRYRRSAG